MKCSTKCPKGLCDCCYECVSQDICEHCCFVPAIQHYKNYSKLQTKIEKGESYKLKDYESLKKISCENDISNTSKEYDYTYFDWGSIDLKEGYKVIKADFELRERLWTGIRKKKKGK